MRLQTANLLPASSRAFKHCLAITIAMAGLALADEANAGVMLSSVSSMGAFDYQSHAGDHSQPGDQSKRLADMRDHLGFPVSGTTSSGTSSGASGSAGVAPAILDRICELSLPSLTSRLAGEPQVILPALLPSGLFRPPRFLG